MEMASFSRLLNPSPLKGPAFPHPQKRETEMRGRERFQLPMKTFSTPHPKEGGA